jgi:superfamily I DNA/RNA helicase/mRNA-degrading endonuclease YafQ of YafQ-DinJ toxin-antitoxin module
MARDLIVSDDFLSGLDELTPDLKNRAMEKIKLLSENPAHPSLNAHKLKKFDGKWECYINMAYRIIYEPLSNVIRLWKIGDHSIIDKVHTFSFAAHTPFRRFLKEEKTAVPKEEFAIPEEWYKPQPELADYPFQYFNYSHLRILGVPTHLVKAVRKAPTLESLEKIQDLSEQTKLWLFELATETKLEDVLFDPVKLFFRSTLDQLEGYCKGKIKRLMLNLEEEQKQYVDKEFNEALLLRGCAGSGKTTVAIYRAINFAMSGEKTIFLTFNKTLAKAAKTLIQELIGELPSYLEVSNIDAWVMRFIRTRGHHVTLINSKEQRDVYLHVLKSVQLYQRSYVYNFPWTFFRDEIARVIKGNGITKEEDYLAIPRYGRKTALKRKARSATWAIFEAYQQKLQENKWIDWQDLSLIAYKELFKSPLTEPYKYVIVDESQDLTSIQVRIAQRLMKGKSAADTSIFMVGDYSQTLYSRGFSWKQAGLQIQGKSYSLRRNFRNTHQIAETASALNAYNEHVKMSGEYVDPLFTNRQGPWPVLLQCDITDREIKAIAEKILDLAGDNQFRLSDFAVLCPTVKLCNSVKSKFDQLDIPCILRDDEQFDILEDKIKVLTIHSAKGLEFPVVFIIGLHNGVLPNPIKAVDDEETEIANERERTLLYVAMTRAAEGLYLVSSEENPSSFINEIIKLLKVETYKGGKQNK